MGYKMNEEWTYRPPVLIGERVVWLGGEATPSGAEGTCNYHPHHGTIGWIGRIPEIGNDLIVGVEFELDMAGGCDGSWKGRRLFTCPRMRGLFLPVGSVIKEKEFYDNKNSLSSNLNEIRISSQSCSKALSKTNVDVSLSPETPPSKNKVFHPSLSIFNNKSPKKQNEAGNISSKSGLENGEEKSPNLIQKSVSACVPPLSADATLITSTPCSSSYTSKKQLLAGRHINTEPQDTSHDYSFSQERNFWTASSGSLTETGATSQLENEGDFNENLNNESMYFGETLVRKSTITSKGVCNTSSEMLKLTQPSISTPSSPSLSDYMRHSGKTSSFMSASPNDSSKCMSTPGRYSSPRSPYAGRKERSGLFGIFRWFKNKKKRSTSIDGMSNTSSGSITSLSSSISMSAYSPLIRSKSIDNQSRVDTKNQGQFGVTRRYRLFSKNSSGSTNFSSEIEESGRRLSVISASSDTSSRAGSRGTISTRKKRPAPQPPGSPKLSDSESVKSQKSCASLPNTKIRPIKTSESRSPSYPDQLNGTKLHKSKSEGVIYSKVKRRAPLPPIQLPPEEMISKERDKSVRKVSHKSQTPSIPSQSKGRPVSTVSNVSSFSQSLSSASTTLKSQSSSVTSSGASISQFSNESVVTESRVLKQDIAKSSSSPSIAETGKVSLSPRPWYKRKNKNKDNKNFSDKEKKETVYDRFMPEIQFSRQKLGLGGTLNKSKSDGKYDQHPQSSKEEKKEKRKSQLSLLASISELDKAALEQMQKKQENKQVQKETYDSKFYRTNEPHFLTQTDFLPQGKEKDAGETSDLGTLSSSGADTMKSSASINIKTEGQITQNGTGLYDNFSLSDQDYTLPLSYSKQTTLRVEEKEKLQHSERSQVRSDYDTKPLVETSRSFEVNSFSSSHSRYVTNSNDKVQNTPATSESSAITKRDSPIHRATIDAELFYQLAKDTQSPPEAKGKTSPVMNSFRENKKLTLNGDQIEEETPQTIDSPSSPRRSNKNFGFRMNNFFSPDVSTIIEASESMTSNATTPADDIYDDLPISYVTGKGRQESLHDEACSEVNFEFHLNSSDAREIMKELADVKQEIEKINEEEEKEFREKQKKKAEKIREEVLVLREANNFQAWHNVIEQNDYGGAEKVPTSPINVNGDANRKLKWVCETCTLNNLPWRLQCEACLARRPTNPKRVDDDGKSVTSDLVSPQGSISNESSMTVIFEDGNTNRECSGEVLEGAGCLLPNNEKLLMNEKGSPTDKKKKDINWEKELQKYFRTFDEHVKVNVSENSQKKSVNVKKKGPGNDERLNKVPQVSEKETGGAVANNYQVKSESENKGAKPKIKFFGTASGPPDTFIGGGKSSNVSSEVTQQKVLSFNIKESHTKENLEKEPDMEAIRRARLARFHQERNEEHVMEAYGIPEEGKNTKIVECTRRTSDSVSERQEHNCTMFEVNESIVQRRDSVELEMGFSKTQDNCCNKSNRKPQIIKPSGAVRAAVSIFNQFEQLQQANNEKPSISRRKSSTGNLTDRTRTFEHLHPENISPEIQRVTPVSRKLKDSCLREKEVFSAIAKFDEMAAIAELENIEKFRRKSKVTRRPKVSKISITSTHLTNDKAVVSSNIDNGSQISRKHTAPSSSSTDLNYQHGNACHGSKSPLKLKETSEGIIKDGVLYTEHRKHSMSVSSGTFELIHAEDFMNIEAQHSESTGYSDSTLNTDVIHPPEIIVEQVNGCTRNVSDNSIFVTPKTGTELEVRPHLERKKDVERLSYQLTEAEGIATFKANLRVEEPVLGQTNTLHINKLLKRLEGAISRGNHAEASKLAHELANFRVSCSVTRNDKSMNTNTQANICAHQVNSLSDSQGMRQSADAHLHTESQEIQTVSSSVSECYYDASEEMNDELTRNAHDELLDAASTNMLKELMRQQNINADHQTTIDVSSMNTLDTPILPQSNHAQKTDLSRDCFMNTKPQQINKKAEVPSMKETPKISNSPSTARREIRVDPARREVKSDTITIFPDGLHLHMKEEKQSNQPFYVKMYVEDKNSHQGPLSFAVTSTMTVGQLREKVCLDFGFPPEVQRWILGKRLADDDSLTLEHHRVTSEGCPIFLYLVAPELDAENKSSKKRKAQGSGYEEKDQELEASGGGATGMTTRYLKVYDDEGNVEYRYYNPESGRYEVSVDSDDDSDQDKEENDDDDDDDGYDDDLEDEIEEERIDTRKTYHNINQNERRNFGPTDDDIHRACGHNSQNDKYSLPPPIAHSNTGNNKLHQKNSLNIHPGVTNGSQEISFKTNETQSGNCLEHNAVQPTTNHLHSNKGKSGTASSLESYVLINKNTNNNRLTKISQKDGEINPQDKRCDHTQAGRPPSLKSEWTPQSSQKSKYQDTHPSNEPNKHQASSQVSPENQSDNNKELSSNSSINGWVCPTCTLVNKWSRPGCEACAMERPNTSHQQATGDIGKGSGLGAVVSVLDRKGYVPNPDAFECRICFLDVESGQGVVLRDCLHTFCRDCLGNAIKYSETAEVKCPYRDSQYSCDSSLQDREIKALITEKEYDQHLKKSVKQAEGAMENVFHCKTPDCPGFCQFEDNVNEFHCDVCGKVNCLTCQAQHGGITCQEYQDDLAKKVDEAAMKTKKFFDDMIRRGDGLPCPKCSVMLVRKWGCDWMRCPMCRTEICWVTRGPRWGPGGPGDVSGGCKCGIRGQKCHPKCTYCH